MLTCNIYVQLLELTCRDNVNQTRIVIDVVRGNIQPTTVTLARDGQVFQACSKVCILHIMLRFNEYLKNCYNHTIVTNMPAKCASINSLYILILSVGYQSLQGFNVSQPASQLIGLARSLCQPGFARQLALTIQLTVFLLLKHKTGIVI